MRPGPSSPSARDGVDPNSFRRVVGRFATGITIVTTVADGMDHAMTVNAFTSVSLDPVLVLFCAAKAARFHAAVTASGLWAVSILGEDAEDASRFFSTSGRRLEGQLDGWPYRRGERTRAAIFKDAIAALECRTYATYGGGDHTIIVGEVLTLDLLSERRRPLVFLDGRYTTVR